MFSVACVYFMYEVEMCLGIVFNCSMENVVCVRAASLVVSKETKWSYEKVEKGSAYRGTCEGLCSP